MTPTLLEIARAVRNGDIMRAYNLAHDRHYALTLLPVDLQNETLVTESEIIFGFLAKVLR